MKDKSDNNDGKCLFPECGVGAAARGLCPAHYRAAFDLVKAKKVTWESLEKSGKAQLRGLGRKLGSNKKWFLSV